MTENNRKKADDLLLQGEYQGAIRHYVMAATLEALDPVIFQLNFSLARRRFRSARAGQPLKVGVCGWELSHNAAGRVRTLADIWGGIADTEILGATFERWGNDLWPPIRNEAFPVHKIHVTDDSQFLSQALELVLAHPYDVVHLSKPRMPNILFGLLYKLIWDAQVILDIDDEELGAIQAEAPIGLEELKLKLSEGFPLQDLVKKDWTRVAVGRTDCFDAVTVSNAALKAKYGGLIVPHARPAGWSQEAAGKRTEGRRKHGIEPEKKVVLFFGTPRKHKGLLETAEAIASLKRKDLCYLVVGDFPDPAFKEQLAAIKGLDIRFLPNQPYESASDIIALGDACVLLQSEASLLGRYQLPAKLVDALAAGLVVFAQPTSGMMEFIANKVVVPTTLDLLPTALSKWLDDATATEEIRKAGNEHFLANLSVEACRPGLAGLVKADRPPVTPGGLFTNKNLQLLFEALGEWRLFAPAAPSKAPGPKRIAAPDQKKQTIVYSVLVGDYETVKEPAVKDPSVRYILFTDNPELKSDHWEVIPLDTLGLTPRRASRLPKLLPHRYLPGHDISVYLDSSLTIIEPDIGQLTRDALGDAGIAAYPHFERNCIYDEITECVAKDKVDPFAAASFADRLRAEGFPENLGLLENAFLVRRNTEEMRALNEAWHKEFFVGPGRDQFHLMYLLWKQGIRWRPIKNAPQFRKSPHLRFKAHTGAISPGVHVGAKKPRINWVIGGPSSKGWAYENNARRLIAQMPEFEHVVNDTVHADCAVYFDTIIHQNFQRTADHAVLRLGGPNPVRRVFGDDPEAVAEGLSAFDAIIPLSGELRRLTSGASALVRMMPNGLDLAQYRPVGPDGQPNATFTLGFAANCKNQMERAFKGLDLLEKAVARTGVRLVTLQKGRNQIPHDRMVPDFFHRIDCLVHPVGPGKEGCSNVIMEALACGVPVITTRTSGYHGEQLIHGVNVLFCERNADSLAEQIARLRDDPALRARLSRNGARFARRHHDLTDTGRQVARVLHETIAPDSLLPLQRPRLRIAMITKTFWPKFAGMELMVHNLATALQHMGNDVVLFARSYKESFTEIVHDYTLERYDPVFPALRAAFARRHQERPFDLIYVQGAYLNASMAHMLKEEFGIPVVLRTHGQDIQTDPETGYGFRLDPKVDAEITRNLREADVNVSISRHILRNAQEAAPDADHRMISNGVDARHFDRPRNRNLHERFNLPPETRILLTVGRNVRVKSFHLAVEALALVRQQQQDVVLVHVGKEGNGENLRVAAERAGVSDVFFEYGEANYFDMPDIYAGADIFVFPSKLESFGNVTVEAMAAGLPCVEFDYGANHDKIVQGTTGYIVPYGDTQGMADQVLRLLADPEKRTSCGRASKHHIRQTFDWPIIARHYHDAFLDHTLRQGRPGALKPRLRIAFAADKMIRIKGGGGEKSLTTLANSMAQRGHEVFLIIKEPGVSRHEAPFYPLHPGVTLCNIYGWDTEVPPKVSRPALLKATLARLQPDVVVGFFLPEFGYIARGCEGLDVPLILSHRNDPKEKLKNTAERYPKRLPDIEFANARAQVLTVQMPPYIDLLPEAARSKAVVIPNSVLPVADELKARPDLPSERNVILNVARLASAKNQALMITAFSRIAEKYADWDIHIYGDGPLKPAVAACIAELGLAERVILKGTTQDIMPAYQNAKIFAFPSLYEGFSRALSEAMMHGLPSAVIEDCICSRTFIGESKGGIVVSNDVENYAAALEELIADPAKRRSMGEKARRYISRFSPNAIDDLWEEHLLRTCALSPNARISWDGSI